MQTSRAATSRDVAALAGVAQSTVSSVINGKKVAPETKRRVEEAMRKLRYQPNAGARTLRTSKTKVIALVVHLGVQDDPAETVPYIETVIDEARSRDYEVVLNTVREGPAEITRLGGRAICDGFVIMDVQTLDDRVAAAAQLSTPAVLVGRPADAHGLDVVDFDTWKAGELLIDELASTGHRHVAAYGADEDAAKSFRFISDFYEGARQRAEKHGVDFHVVPRTGTGWDDAEDVGDVLLEHADDRLGLIALTPRDTRSLVHQLQRRGLVAGRDVSLASRCTDEMATSFALPITNVSPRPREMSRIATTFLFERLGGDTSAPRVELVEPEPVVRRATTAVFEPATQPVR